MQPGGSFKIRGAVNALMALRSSHPDVREVVTASTGNHGVAMAIAARDLGLGLRVHVPRTAPEAKRKALVALGAMLLEAGAWGDPRDGPARKSSTERPMSLAICRNSVGEMSRHR